MDKVPAIDLTPFLPDGEHAAVVKEFRDASKRIGFVVVPGYGLPEQLLDRAFAQSLAFFALPPEVKRQATPTIPGQQRGYNGIATRNLGQTLGVDVPPDLRASLSSARSTTTARITHSFRRQRRGMPRTSRPSSQLASRQR
jgi:isopenicillin N synthase-like dioxygenase